MKFIVNSAYLCKHLSILNGVITTNPSLPILENYLFQVDQSKLTITASDLQTSIQAGVKIESKESGDIAIPAKKLLDTLKSLPDQPISFDVDQSTFTIKITSENGTYKLAGENATDFPKKPKISYDYSTSVASEVLIRAINHTVFAAGNDEMRVAMTGVYINLDKEKSSFVSTDGHRLVRFQRTDLTAEKEKGIIVPRRALHLLKTCLSNEKTEVTIHFNTSGAFFQMDSYQVACRLIDERYPDYENVIPLDNPITMIINRETLLNSMRRVSIYSSSATHQIRLKIKGKELIISAEDRDFSNEADEHLTCIHEGEDIEIGFNSKLFIELLSHIESNEVEFNLSTPTKAGVLIPVDRKENENILMLIVPVMLSQYP